jgi:hypothetical protein
MKSSLLSPVCFACIALSALAVAHSPLHAQDTPPATSDSRTQSPTFKPGDKIQALWGSSWWDATIVSDKGDGKYVIKWSDGNWPTEVKKLSEIKATEPSENEPASKIGDKNPTDATTAGAKEKVVAPIVSAPKSPAGLKPGTYLRGQAISADDQGTLTNGTVIRDMGSKVIVRTDSDRVQELPRQAIITSPTVRPPALGYAKLDMSSALLQADLSRGLVQPPPTTAGFQPGPATLDTPPRNNPIKFTNPTGVAQLPPQNLFISPIKPVGFISFKGSDELHPACMTRFDLLKGAPESLLLFPGASQIIDVSPDNARVLTETSGILTLWSITDAKPTKILSLEPYAEGSTFNPATDRAYLFGADMAVIIGEGGKEVVAWRFSANSAKAIWLFTADKPCCWSITPQRTALAYNDWSSLYVIDPATGSHLWAPSDVSFPQSHAFSPDGKSLAVYKFGQSFVILDVVQKKNRQGIFTSNRHCRIQNRSFPPMGQPRVRPLQ